MKYIIQDGLKAPIKYWELSCEQKKLICNACGPKGYGRWIPNKIKWLNFDLTESCNIHDFCYYIKIPKKESDNIFLENNLILSSKCFFFVRHITDRIALIYYLFVKHCGKNAYNNV